MENRVFVPNHNRKSLMPCHPARARQFLREGKAAVFRRSPFTIILHQPTTDYKQPVTWIDAACVGTSGGSVLLHPKQSVLEIKAMGRGSRLVCKMDKVGFPRTSAKEANKHMDFKPGIW